MASSILGPGSGSACIVRQGCKLASIIVDGGQGDRRIRSRRFPRRSTGLPPQTNHPTAYKTNKRSPVTGRRGFRRFRRPLVWTFSTLPVIPACEIQGPAVLLAVLQDGCFR